MEERKENERQRLPDERQGAVHRFTIVSYVSEGQSHEHDFYLRTGEYSDGRLGEFFITAGKDNTPFAAMLDMWAISSSRALQRGDTVSEIFKKFVGQKFEPSGPTSNPKIPRATSVVDYVARYLVDKYGESEEPTLPSLVKGDAQ